MSKFRNLTGAEFPTGSTEYDAKVTSDGEVAVVNAESERDVAIHFNVDAVAATDYYILVDLSDTTNFPHNETGKIHMSYIEIEVDKASNTNASVEIGIITRIDGTDADMEYPIELHFLRNGETRVEKKTKYSPSQLKFSISGGTMDKTITNSIENNVAAVNTGVTLDSPRGISTITPAVGDIIVKYDYSSGGVADFHIHCMYHGEA